jgi:hypothetical protein
MDPSKTGDNRFVGALSAATALSRPDSLRSDSTEVSNITDIFDYGSSRTSTHLEFEHAAVVLRDFTLVDIPGKAEGSCR